MLRDEWSKYENFSGVTGATVMEIRKGSVIYRDRTGTAREIPCDSVVLSVGYRAKSAEAISLAVPGVPFHLIGDCLEPGNIQKLNRTAFGVTAAV